MTIAQTRIDGQAITRPPSPEAIFILALFSLRWLAGIMENNGIPAASEIAAILMLGGLAILLLNRMRVAADSALFCAGIFTWIFSGALSFAANPNADLQATISLLSLLALYGLFANAAGSFLKQRNTQKSLSTVMILFIIAGFALSAFQLISGSGFVESGKQHMQRAFGSDVHPVSFAVQIVAALVAVEILRVKRQQKLTPFHVVVLGLGCLTLYLTFARTAWVMALIIVALVFILRGSLLRRFTLMIAMTCIGAALLISSDRFTDLGSLPFFLANFSFQDAVFDWRYVDNSVSWRIVNWSYGFQQALEQPWLGYGPGQSAVSSYFNLEMHNIFLEVFFEGGIFGLAALIITIFGLVHLHRRLPNATAADKYSCVLANGFGLTLFLAVTFSTSFVDQLMSFLLYILLLSASAAPTANNEYGFRNLQNNI